MFLSKCSEKKTRYLWLKWRSRGPLHALWLLIHCIKQKCPLRPEKRNRNSHYTVIQLRCNLQTTNASSEIEELIFSLTFSSLLTSNYSSSAVWRRKFFSCLQLFYQMKWIPMYICELTGPVSNTWKTRAMQMALSDGSSSNSPLFWGKRPLSNYKHLGPVAQTSRKSRRCRPAEDLQLHTCCLSSTHLSTDFIGEARRGRGPGAASNLTGAYKEHHAVSAPKNTTETSPAASNPNNAGFMQEEAPQQPFQCTQTQSTTVCPLIEPGKASRLTTVTSDCKTIPAFQCLTDLLPVSNPGSSLLITLKSLPPGKFLR